MEVNKTVSNSDDSSFTNSLEDSSSVKKIKLKKEIEDLQNIVERLQKKLSTIPIGLTKNIHNEALTTGITLELYKYTGLHCADIEKKKVVIAFNSSLRDQQENEFMVQFLKEKKNIKIGKWILPMSVDMDILKSEVPLNSVQSVQSFVKNCKHHTDCYTSRLEQFHELKSYIDTLKNCNVQSNLGYTFITLELLHVLDKENNSRATVTIYLWYDSNKSRPSKIEVEMVGATVYSVEVAKKLKASLKVFRLNNLRVAFDDILNDDTTQFMWERVEKDNDTLEIEESSSSEEDEYVFYKKTRRKRSNTKLKERLKNANRRKKKATSSSENLNQEDADVEKANKSTTSETPINVLSSISKRKLLSRSTVTEFTSKTSFKKRKQEDLKILQNKFNLKPLAISLQKLDKKYTSTPVRPHPQSSTPFKVLPTFDISNITVESNF